ncbi:hypothetical protein LDENG_00111940 [Lucifuga dentata]|nr:hypothetical protein LDENG_00111940 [Lucifuga dentata]
MAEELWNRVRIPFPGAASCVHIHFNETTDENVKNVLAENEKVLMLLRSEILQTDIRVLNKLLRILNNSSRGIKTFKALKQVEQCINRLKDMKLDDALQDLRDLCPKKLQRKLSLEAGECDVPSQPMLEWLCLKVLGAAQLMSCTLNRCSSAFLLSKQQMKWEEFIVLNTVIISMLSRLWVFFRGIQSSLASLYQQLLVLLNEVAQAWPMPFLKSSSLPTDIIQFLGPSNSSLLIKQPTLQEKKSSVKIAKETRRREAREDLGVPVQRDLFADTNRGPMFDGYRDPRQHQHEEEKKAMFRQHVRAATTFEEMLTHLKEMIVWCKSKRMQNETRCLSFLRFKCQRLICLEAAGYNVQMKLRSFKQEVCWASSLHGSVLKTRRPYSSMRTNSRLRTRVQMLKIQNRSSSVRIGIKKKNLKKKNQRTNSSLSRLSKYRTGSRPYEARPQTSNTESHDDIDDIFASAGL